MKTVFKFFALILLTSFTLSLSAQSALKDSTLYKVKLEKFSAKEKSGKIMTIGGLSLGVVGALIGYYVGYNPNGESNQTVYSIGVACVPIGVISSVWGGINWSVGHKKVREYSIRLNDIRAGVYYTPDHIAGFRLAFKF
jgi:hypothetical protein